MTNWRRFTDYLHSTWQKDGLGPGCQHSTHDLLAVDDADPAARYFKE